jgi:uncharacterized protein YbjT (DUF2867 family)
MKLIITGATGLVGTEAIRQSLKNPKISSVIALSRRPVTVPEDIGDEQITDKLKSLVLKDFTQYPEDVKAQLADADACIWYPSDCDFKPVLLLICRLGRSRLHH